LKIFIWGVTRLAWFEFVFGNGSVGNGSAGNGSAFYFWCFATKVCVL